MAANRKGSPVDKIRNPNIEIRNKFEFSKFPKFMKLHLFRTFEFWSFEIVSNFGFRASDLFGPIKNNVVSILHAIFLVDWAPIELPFPSIFSPDKRFLSHLFLDGMDPLFLLLSFHDTQRNVGRDPALPRPI